MRHKTQPRVKEELTGFGIGQEEVLVVFLFDVEKVEGLVKNLDELSVLHDGNLRWNTKGRVKVWMKCVFSIQLRITKFAEKLGYGDMSVKDFQTMTFSKDRLGFNPQRNIRWYCFDCMTSLYLFNCIWKHLLN